MGSCFSHRKFNQTISYETKAKGSGKIEGAGQEQLFRRVKWGRRERGGQGLGRTWDTGKYTRESRLGQPLR